MQNDMLKRGISRSVSFIKQNFDHRPFWCFGAIFLLIIGLAFFQVRNIHTNALHSQSLLEGELLTKTFLELRSLYVDRVVNRIRDQENIVISYEYMHYPTGIPMPNTLAIELGEQLSAADERINTKIYSPYPYPHRLETGGLRDEFSKEAWAVFSKDSSKPYYKFVEQDGSQVMRYAVADVMRQPCVDCHNSHPSSPRKDWTVGEVRGIVEVTTTSKMNGSNVFGQFGRTFLAVSILAFLALYAIAFFIRRLKHEKALSDALSLKVSETSATRDEYIRQINHEVGTPMNAIMGFTEMLSLETAGKLNEKQKEYLSHIHNCGNLLLKLTSELAATSTAAGNEAELHMEAVLPSDLVNKSTSIIHPFIAKKHIQLHIDKDIINMPTIWADPKAASQVMVNLLSNAVKYGHERGNIWISCLAIEDKRLRFTVRDDGIGISNRDSRHVFDFTYRGKSSATGVEGSGIGLAVAKSLVERMGGKIWFKSKLGEGTIFTIELEQYQANKANGTDK